MGVMQWIALIGQMLSLAGITSIRMFLPTFLFFGVLKIAQYYPEYAPDSVLYLAERTPSWQVSVWFLSFLGILAGLEIAAMRVTQIKEFLTLYVDKYSKPVCTMLFGFGILSSAQSEAIVHVIETPPAAEASMMAFFIILLCGAFTALGCKLRETLLDLIHTIDPDNTFYLQTISNYGGETLLIVIFLLAMLLPVLALILALIGGAVAIAIRHALKFYEKKHSHLCCNCQNSGVETWVLNCARFCPVCGQAQENVCRVGWFGFPTSKPLDNMSMLAHEEKLISFKRCRWCAAEIKDVMVCSTCGKEIWDNEFFNSFCRSQDRFFWICSLLALVVSVLPVGVLVGYPLLVCADRTYFKYLKFEGRLVASLLLNFLKTLLFLILLLCSTIPGVGTIVLIPFFIKALYSRHKFRRMISSKLAAGTQPAQVIPEIVS